MRILYITAGAAGMYCGSCLRDNALAAELISRGHEVTLLPLYTPTLTDDRNVSQQRVFFGAISVYLQQHLALFRKTPWLLDRIWDSAFALRLASQRSIQTNPRLLGELTLSMLRGTQGFQSKEVSKLLQWLQNGPPPDIVNLPNSLLIGLAQPIKKTLHRPIFCTLQGEDLFLEGLREPYRSSALELIGASLKHVDAFIAVSTYYAKFMSDYLGIPHSKIHVVPLGINLQGYAARPGSRSNLFTIGYFARITPEKGLHLLCAAYRHLRQQRGLPQARLEAAGYLGPEYQGYLREIERQMKTWGLANEFSYRGTLDRQDKIAFLQNLDVLSVPGSYKEPKGLYVLEAMANGVPAVQPRHGAFPEIFKKAPGGILVEPDHTESLAEGLLTIWQNPSLAEELRRKGVEGVREHFSAARMADRALEVYSRLLEMPARQQSDAALAGYS